LRHWPLLLTISILLISFTACTIPATQTADKPAEQSASPAAASADQKPAQSSDQKASDNTGNAQTGKGKTIGVSSMHTSNDWTKFASDAVKKTLEDKGYTIIHTNAQNVTSQQVKDVENLIAKKVDGIIIAGGEQNAFVDISLKAKEAGIPIVAMEMYLPGALCGVMVDNYTGGTQCGLFMVNHMQGAGKYIVLNTPGWQTLTIRKRMAQAVMEDFPDMQQVGEFEVAGDAVQVAYEAVKGALRNNPDLKGVLSTWGLPVVGAAKAVQEAGLEKQVVLMSADSDRPVLAKMAEENAPLIANIGQDPRLNGQFAAEILDRALTEGVQNLPKVVLAPTFMVSNDDYTEDFAEIIRIGMADLWDKVYTDQKREFESNGKNVSK
jgi:ribose transport system substrate-binding protein